MAKTKRYAKRSKSRKIKRGGRKTNNTALKVSQMLGGTVSGTVGGTVGGAVGVQVGGQPAPLPAPAPASILKLANLDEQSVKTALQSFGDAALGLQDAVAQGVKTAASLLVAVEAQKEALDSLETSANSLATSITGTNGLYNRIVIAPFVATPEPPAPRPAPAPPGA
jgi:hypothetical protein